MTTNGYTEISGIVVRVNERGFQLQGREAWLNVSKFAAVALPEVGERVCVGLDKAGYVRMITPEDAGAVSPLDTRTERRGSSPPAPADPPPDAPESRSAPSDRDVHIMRQAVLNTAVAMLSSGGRVADPDAVLQLASRLEQWVCRG